MSHIKLYQEECEKLCIPVLPAIIKQLETKPDTLDFQRNYIGDKQAIAIAAALKNYHPSIIKLPQNGLMNLGLRNILAAVEGTNITSIDISRNDFSPSCIRDICRVVINTASLQEVKVVQCQHLKPEHIKQIQDSFEKKYKQ